MVFMRLVGISIQSQQVLPLSPPPPPCIYITSCAKNRVEHFLKNILAPSAHGGFAVFVYTTHVPLEQDRP